MQLRGKKILARLDFNVPIKDGAIQDENRIRATLPTLRHVLEQGGSLIACSHLGKPKGEAKPELSLRPVAERLGQLLGVEVKMAPDCVGDDVERMVRELQPGEVLMLENLRFHPGETKNDPEFSQKLADLADVYVNDAFGVVHRAHASVSGVPERMAQTCAGFLLKKEVEYLSKVLENPERPFVLIAGGAKVSDKLGILNNMIARVNRILVGGAMANTFRKAGGYPVAESKIEEDLLDSARQVMSRARENGVSFYLPVDYLLGTDPSATQPIGVQPYQDLPDAGMILDTGPATHTLFSEVLKDAQTVVWNGPMGAFENPTFSQGSVGLAQAVGGLDALTVVGGGDTDSLVHKCGLENDVSFISTGGGSFLEFLEGKDLPGLQPLK
jgi:phosphoglycerate kinase